MSAGGKLECFTNTTETTYKGIISTVGKGNWLVKVSPYLFFRQNTRQLWIGANSSPLRREDIQSGINHISSYEERIGNIYLRPSYNYDIKLQYTYYKATKLNIILCADIFNKEYVSAIWNDINGKRYTLPVNSDVPTYKLQSFLSIAKAFGKSENWYLSFYATGGYDSSTIYLSDNKLSEIDKDHFDYIEFMKSIWGNENGNIFYSGASGFKRCQTGICKVKGNLSSEYRNDFMTISIEVMPEIILSKYSNFDNGKHNAGTISVIPSMDFLISDSWYIGTNINYQKYFGYGYSYNRSIWDWEIDISKDIGMFSISLSAYDILNQSRSIIYDATALYRQSSMTNNLGRSIILGIAYNFGKSNTTAERKANVFNRNYSKF